MKLNTCSQALVRDLLACAVPPNMPALSRLPLGAGSLDTAASGSPKSMAGEWTASFVTKACVFVL